MALMNSDDHSLAVALLQSVLQRCDVVVILKTLENHGRLKACSISCENAIGSSFGITTDHQRCTSEPGTDAESLALNPSNAR
nr:hypothetical protein CFP56_31026 [Quercus suber]